jgi:hypothetical protein
MRTPRHVCPLHQAEVLRKRADAFKEFGQAALIQSIVDRLPEIATAMAAPLAKTEVCVRACAFVCALLCVCMCRVYAVAVRVCVL